ncbi:hypothetical protein [Dongia deserti]|uniref:hypothetical protein n=1 Tax=Dongia deserti TaxID=2268030 RepID=UPI000E64EDBD|nr:hypothetical protein [Dongia deserti]
MNLKHVLIGAIVLAVFLLGGLWLFLRQVPPSHTLSSFQQTCIEGQRRGISGNARPLDDATETRLLAFCDCVAEEVVSRLSQQDIAAIGLEQSSQAIDAKLAAIFARCRMRNP